MGDCDDMAAQATPANWPNNHESIGKKGQAFLLPTVTPEDAKSTSLTTAPARYPLALII